MYGVNVRSEIDMYGVDVGSAKFFG